MAIVKINGAQLDVELLGSGPELVVLHSLLTDRSAFDRVKGELAAAHRRVCLVNLPGYGASSPVGSTIEGYADHIAGLFTALKLSPRAAVLGNGFGGFIALALAARHGARFDRLIVADSVATFPPPAKEPFRILHAKVSEHGMSAVLDAAVRRMFPQAFILDHPKIVAERKAALAKADPQCFARACLALAEVDLRPAVGAIRNPALVMAGSLDQTTPPALVRELAEAMPGARFHEIPGSGHCPQIEKPAEFVAAVRAFLAAP
jgi:3-oxoadipate enol-lactonase